MDPITVTTPEDDIETAYDDAVAALPDGIGTTAPPGSHQPGTTVDAFVDGKRPRDRGAVKEFLEDGEVTITVRGYSEGAQLHPAEVDDIEEGIERVDAYRDSVLWREEFEDHLDRMESCWRAEEDGSPVVYETGDAPFSVERPSYHGWALGVAERAVRRAGGEVTGYRIAIEPDDRTELYEAIQEPDIVMYGEAGSDAFRMTYGPTEEGYGFEEDGVPDDIVEKLEDNGLETV